jgi:uncharacterized protein
VVGGSVERPAGVGSHPGAPSIEADHRALVVAVAAPAVDGKANEAVRRAVAEAFGVRARDVTVVSGERSRDKVLEIGGADEARLAELLNG